MTWTREMSGVLAVLVRIGAVALPKTWADEMVRRGVALRNTMTFERLDGYPQDAVRVHASPAAKPFLGLGADATSQMEADDLFCLGIETLRRWRVGLAFVSSSGELVPARVEGPRAAWS